MFLVSAIEQEVNTREVNVSNATVFNFLIRSFPHFLKYCDLPYTISDTHKVNIIQTLHHKL